VAFAELAVYLAYSSIFNSFTVSLTGEHWGKNWHQTLVLGTLYYNLM
jgi:hypothetical protein